MCKREFTFKRNLKAHTKIHNENRLKFKCNASGCKRNFFKMCNLKQHYAEDHRTVSTSVLQMWLKKPIAERAVMKKTDFQCHICRKKLFKKLEPYCTSTNTPNTWRKTKLSVWWNNKRDFFQFTFVVWCGVFFSYKFASRPKFTRSKYAEPSSYLCMKCRAVYISINSEKLSRDEGKIHSAKL